MLGAWSSAGVIGAWRRNVVLGCSCAVVFCKLNKL